jgi:uncharacterized protein (TIGR02145 family)
MKNKINLTLFITYILYFIFTVSCKKETDDNIAKILPILTTSNVSEIMNTSAKCGGIIIDDRGPNITEKGICWSYTSTPTIADSKTSDGTGKGSFSSVMNGLSAQKTYYVRAYATTFAGTGYGNLITFTTIPDITDLDGNIYHTLIIGTQTWMVENLKVTHYRNGDPILNTTWSNNASGAYCDYNNIQDISSIYGRLYNWYTTVDSRNLCPSGWHAPSNSEWELLIKYLGGVNIAGGGLKEIGTTHWAAPNTGANNLSGFTALPGGECHGSFDNIGTQCFFWSTSPYADLGLAYQLTSDYNYISWFGTNKESGFSVRCIKDSI